MPEFYLKNTTSKKSRDADADQAESYKTSEAADVEEDPTELDEIARIKAEFVAMVSHELRTPLTTIHGGIKLITKGIVPVESEQAQQLLQAAAISSQRLIQLVDDILTLESPVPRQLSIKKQQVNTRMITSQVVDSFELIRQKYSVDIEVCDPDIKIYADSDRIVQVLTNLIDNAIKFSPPGSTIKITVTSDAGYQDLEGECLLNGFVLFSICDRGEGILVENQAEIFERFVQVRETDARKQGGTGLGLAICRSIIEQHSGKIWVESTEGEGSCFYFTLPVV